MNKSNKLIHMIQEKCINEAAGGQTVQDYVEDAGLSYDVAPNRPDLPPHVTGSRSQSTSDLISKIKSSMSGKSVYLGMSGRPQRIEVQGYQDNSVYLVVYDDGKVIESK